jgi:hypothetical protein
LLPGWSARYLSCLPALTRCGLLSIHLNTVPAPVGTRRCSLGFNSLSASTQTKAGLSELTILPRVISLI